MIGTLTKHSLSKAIIGRVVVVTCVLHRVSAHILDTASYQRGRDIQRQNSRIRRSKGHLFLFFLSVYIIIMALERQLVVPGVLSKEKLAKIAKEELNEDPDR